MIAPEYFNNHIAVEGEIIVKRVPNDTGSVLVWNPTTKKISIRTHAEIVADLNLVTTNTLALYHKRDPAFALNNASDTHTNQTWFDYNWAGTGKSGSVINVSGFGGDYSTELFAAYNDYYAAIRSRQGDYSQWNDPMVLWHNKNFNPANYQTIGSYVTLDTDQSIDGRKTYNAYFDSYTSDGLFNSNARTLKVNTPSANKILFGYKDYGGGQYYSRIGFLNNGLTNWSAGPLGNNFVIGINNDGVETFRIHPSGATSSIASNTQVFQRVYQGAYPDTTHQTGMLVLKMPQASVDQAMFSIDINVYGYESQYLGKINVSFYKYVSGLIIQNGSKALFNVTENFPTNVARVGIGSDGLVSIIIGQPDTFWGSYTSFEVERVQIHYANYYQDWSNGWSHALETDLSVYGNNIIVLPTDVTATKSWVTGNLNTQLGNYWAKSSTAGYTGIDASIPFAVLNAGYAQKVYMGGLLVSDAYQDEGNVPAQGAYIKGNIVGNSNIDIANRVKAQKLVGNYQGTTSGQNLGSAGIGSTLELRNYDLYGTNFWTDDNGWGFIQQQRFDGNPVAYDLRLQPFGGLLLYGANEVATVNQLPNMSNYIPITHPSYSLTQNNVDYLVYMTNTGMASLADLLNYIPLSQKGVANGVATLDSSGLVPATQLPSYVDDVLEFANLASFPTNGESGKIYVETDTNQTYRWSGSTYIQIASGAVQSVNGQTGIVNLTKSDIGLGNVDNTADAIKNVLSAVNIKSTLINLTQLNSFDLEAGMYRIEDVDIGHGGSFYNHIIQTGKYSGGGHICQIAIPFEGNNSMFLRVSDYNGFGSWERIAKNSDIATAISSLSGIYEPAFTKNTAFNKNFGTSAGTVAEGNDGRINNGQTAFDYGNHKGINENQWLGSDYVGGGHEKPNSPYFGAGKLKLQMLSGSNLGAFGGWNDVLWMSSYVGQDVKKSTAIISSKNGNEIGFCKQDFDATNWGNYIGFWTSDNLPNPVDQSQLTNYITKDVIFITNADDVPEKERTNIYRIDSTFSGVMYQYAPLLHMGAQDTMAQLQVNYATGNANSGELSYRGGYGANIWDDWRTAWDNRNLPNPFNITKNATGLNANTLQGTELYTSTDNWTNKPSWTNSGSGSLLNINTYYDVPEYGFQMYMDTESDSIGFRSRHGSATFSDWNKIITQVRGIFTKTVRVVSQGSSDLNLANEGVNAKMVLANGIGEFPAYGMKFGVEDNGDGHIQQQRFDGSSASYALNIQPLGGVSTFRNYNRTSTEDAIQSYGKISAYGNESNSVKTWIHSGGINTNVAGHEYHWYNDVWRIGSRRGGGIGSTGFVFEFSTDQGATYKSQVTFGNDGYIDTSNYGNSSQWQQAYNWGNHALAGYSTQTWVSQNYMPTTHVANTITLTNIHQWNDIYNYGIRLNQQFTINTGSRLMLSDAYFGSESGLVDGETEFYVAGKTSGNTYYKYGSNVYDGWEGINFHYSAKLIGIGKEITNDEDKVQIAGNISVDTVNISDVPTELVLNPLYNTDGDVRRSRNAHIYIVTGNSVRLPDKPILGQRIEIFNDSDSEIEVAHGNVGTMFYVPRFCKVTGIAGARGFIFDEKPVPAKKYDV